MKHSTYPYAPLLPITAVTQFETTATAYGIGLGVDAGPGLTRAKTERDGDRTVWLAARLRADARQLEFGPLPAVAK